VRADGPAPARNRKIARWLAAIAVVAAALIAGAALAFERGWLGEADVEVGTPPAAAPELTAEEVAYYDYVAPRLRELAAQARELARLGEEKSRNLIEIQARGRRLDELVDEIAAYGREHGIPARFAAVAAGFAEGARLTGQAMEESQSGFRSFDWGRVAAAVPVFLDGADRLDAAAVELERLGGAGTPAVGFGRRAGKGRDDQGPLSAI
jgi:hypothetical protein